MSCVHRGRTGRFLPQPAQHQKLPAAFQARVVITTKRLLKAVWLRYSRAESRWFQIQGSSECYIELVPSLQVWQYQTCSETRFDDAFDRRGHSLVPGLPRVGGVGFPDPDLNSSSLPTCCRSRRRREGARDLRSPLKARCPHCVSSSPDCRAWSTSITSAGRRIWTRDPVGEIYGRVSTGSPWTPTLQATPGSCSPKRAPNSPQSSRRGTHRWFSLALKLTAA
jgi:hypothetical protein